MAYEKNNEINLIIPNKFKNDVEIKLKNLQRSKVQKSIIEILYPDKLKNLNGHSINTIYIANGLTQNYDLGNITGRFPFFLDVMHEKMNATINLIELRKDLNYTEKTIYI